MIRIVRRLFTRKRKPKQKKNNTVLPIDLGEIKINESKSKSKSKSKNKSKSKSKSKRKSKSKSPSPVLEFQQDHQFKQSNQIPIHEMREKEVEYNKPRNTRKRIKNNKVVPL